MADDVDRQKSVRIGQFAQVSPHARDLAGRPSEQHAPAAAKRGAHTIVDVPADLALHILRPHDVIQAVLGLHQHMPHALAARLPSSAADDATSGQHFVRKQREHTARRGREPLVLVFRLRPHNGLDAVLGPLAHHGANRVAPAAANAHPSIDLRPQESAPIGIHDDAGLRTLCRARAAAAARVTKPGYLRKRPLHRQSPNA